MALLVEPPGRQGRPTLRGLRTALALGLLAVVSWGCDSNLTDPGDALDAVVCVPPAALLAEVDPQPFGLAALYPALLHVAGPMASALGSSEQVRQLTLATNAMTEGGPAALDTACRLLLVASRALETMPDNPETLPDREGIRLVLLLTASAIKGGNF